MLVREVHGPNRHNLPQIAEDLCLQATDSENHPHSQAPSLTVSHHHPALPITTTTEQPGQHRNKPLPEKQTLEVFAREEFPCVTYWYKEQWKGDDGDVTYLQKANGDAVTKLQARSMKDYAVEIWQIILEHSTLLLPIKWGQATHQTKEFYWYSLESRFVELRLCENHWKAQAIATRYYPNFVKKYMEQIHAQYGSRPPLIPSSSTNEQSATTTTIQPGLGQRTKKARKTRLLFNNPL